MKKLCTVFVPSGLTTVLDVLPISHWLAAAGVYVVVSSAIGQVLPLGVTVVPGGVAAAVQTYLAETSSLSEEMAFDCGPNIIWLPNTVFWYVKRVYPPSG